MQFLTIFSKRKIIIIVLAFLVLVLAGGVIIIWQIIESKKESVGELTDEELILYRGKPSAVFELGQTAKVGQLEITAYDFKEGLYQTGELDENYRRITENYFGVQIKVFNPFSEKTEELLIGLIDNKGNRYKLAHMIGQLVPELKPFGWNMNIYPQTIHEGYIYFSNLDKETKNLQLIFAVASTKEKVAFKIKR